MLLWKAQETESLLEDETDDTVEVIFDDDDDDDYPSFTAQVVNNKEQHTKETSSCYCAEWSLAGGRETQEWKVEFESDSAQALPTQGKTCL